MTATAHAIGGTAASTGRLPSVASGVTDFVWPLYLTLVLTLGAWVLVPTVVLGWQPVTIISGSMAPAVQPGHVVVVEPYRAQELRPGAVVTYRDVELDRLVTHRIVSVEGDGTFTTRGDANAVDDPRPLTADRIVGVGRLVVPAAGLPALWAHEGRTHLLAGVAVLTAFAAAAAASAASDGARRFRRRVSLRGGTSRRRGRGAVGLLAAVAVVASVLGATVISRAAFVGAEENQGNSFSAAALTTPTGLKGTRGCFLLGLLAPHVDLTWSGSSDRYEILRSTSSSSGYTSLATTSSTSHTDTTVVLGGTYHYRVRAIAGSWTSPSTDPVQVTIPLVCT